MLVKLDYFGQQKVVFLPALEAARLVNQTVQGKANASPEFHN
jgi:hypothetical protein